MSRGLLLALLVLVLLATAGGGTAIVVHQRRKGKLSPTVTNAPAGPDGIVRADPRQLASQANVPLPVYALARMIASEHPRDAELVQVAIAHITLNEARRRGTDVVALLLRSTRSEAQGKFGAQHAGKYAATGKDPTPEHIAVAHKVIAGLVPDPTKGAVQFDVPKAQRAALARGVPGYRKTPEDVAAARRREGKELVTLPGVPADNFRAWRPLKGIA